jgi:hypothetical protein
MENSSVLLLLFALFCFGMACRGFYRNNQAEKAARQFILEKAPVFARRREYWMGELGTQITCGVICLMLLTATESSTANAQSDKSVSYFCATDSAGGLWFNSSSKKWEGSTFRGNEKFVLRLKFLRSRTQKNTFNVDEAVTDYEVTATQAGENFAAPCLGGNKTEVTVDQYGMVECEWAMGELRFNSRNNRFILAYLRGYINGKDNNDDTPSMSGGICTKID